MSIILMICFARSGGTILNKALASLPNIVMLSEVNPLGGGWGEAGPDSYSTVYEQALHWYGIQLKNKKFKESIIELNKFCEEHGKKLLIRDWSFVNFVGHEYNNFTPPKRLLTYEEISELNPKIFVFVRDSIDVWISRGTPDVEQFFEEYLDYVKAVKNLNVPIFKHENFTRNPRSTLKEICNTLGLEYKDVIETCINYKNVNGDVQIKEGSRGAKQRKIKPLARKIISVENISQLDKCHKMVEANKLLRYPTTYYGLRRENIWLIKIYQILRKISRFI